MENPGEEVSRAAVSDENPELFFKILKLLVMFQAGAAFFLLESFLL